MDAAAEARVEDALVYGCVKEIGQRPALVFFYFFDMPPRLSRRTVEASSVRLHRMGAAPIAEKRASPWP